MRQEKLLKSGPKLRKNLHPSEDGFVRSPSVPLGAGLRCNFVVAAPEGPRSLVIGPCPAFGGRAFYEATGGRFRRLSTCIRLKK